jgi:hypothetical protein
MLVASRHDVDKSKKIKERVHGGRSCIGTVLVSGACE